MLIRSQTGDIVNLAHVARIFIDENADGPASVLAAVPIPDPKGPMLYFTLAKFETATLAGDYIDWIGAHFGAVNLPLPQGITPEVSP